MRATLGLKLNLAKDNGVITVTLPPHCSHRLQPLDISVFAPFKANYNTAVDSWLLHHPGNPLSIYEIAACVGIAFERSMTPSNIKSGFKKAGIYPFDRNVFTDDDFLCSSVTDREFININNTEVSIVDENTSSSSKVAQTVTNDTLNDQ
ncbi:unnamed protein product [Acanthoscelides obtectus]|uniref:DDE-1 domain-containing protein n=1 Tax=Acanthoscelides obtectus TaxID=200917 RepID=A0A9P0KLL9_ACAOB|nr:unnamed protein product [Acanthoscelides obtectus]CAK1638604.1 hypothetical protein AOBTE_LOCUS10695 [Acanthoscelides obtectus]